MPSRDLVPMATTSPQATLHTVLRYRNRLLGTSRPDPVNGRAADPYPLGPACPWPASNRVGLLNVKQTCKERANLGRRLHDLLLSWRKIRLGGYSHLSLKSGTCHDRRDITEQKRDRAQAASTSMRSSAVDQNGRNPDRCRNM